MSTHPADLARIRRATKLGGAIFTLLFMLALSLVGSHAVHAASTPGRGLTMNLVVTDGARTGDGLTFVPNYALTLRIVVTNTGTEPLSVDAIIDGAGNPVDMTDCVRSDGSTSVDALLSTVTIACGLPLTSVAGGGSETMTVNASGALSASDTTTYLTAPASISINARTVVGTNLGDGLASSVGDELSWVAEVTNNGGDPLSNIAIIDQSNQHLDMTTCVRSDSEVASAPLLPGDSLRCTTSFVAIAGGETHTFTVSGETSTIEDPTTTTTTTAVLPVVRQGSLTVRKLAGGSPPTYVKVTATDDTSYTTRSASTSSTSTAPSDGQVGGKSVGTLAPASPAVGSVSSPNAESAVAPAQPSLPVTGSHTQTALVFATLFVIIGVVLATIDRRRDPAGTIRVE